MPERQKTYLSNPTALALGLDLGTPCFVQHFMESYKWLTKPRRRNGKTGAFLGHGGGILASFRFLVLRVLLGGLECRL